MKIIEAINMIDGIKPNTFTQAEKLAWLYQLDGLCLDFMRGYEGVDTLTPPFYTEADLEVELLIPPPHDEVYVHYLHAMIMYAMGEFSKYENALVQYNNAMQQFRVGFARTHMPIQPRKRMF